MTLQAICDKMIQNYYFQSNLASKDGPEDQFFRRIQYEKINDCEHATVDAMYEFCFYRLR